MKYAFLAVSVAGIAIGLAMPSGKKQAIAAAPPPLAAGEVDAPRETVIERSDNGHFYTVADVNGEPIKFVVDTGATTVALTLADARRIGLKVDPAEFDVVGSGASGAVRGVEVTLRDLVLDGKRASEVHAVVLEGLTISLLGQSYLRKLDTVSITSDSMKLR
ncbi:TIGR02281 family clan AA aspartic protease [uncultured Sphingomonas sp.]|uniref:retropepsin-like aspartic protease family protein n=1 Tax=uncultured Sphingomonas sp. TaxID=158754 RepID=UPI0035CC5F11